MATANDAFEGEPQNERHGLPGMIGEAINNPEYGTHAWGGHLVRRLEDGTITLYRVIEQAAARDELDETGDYVAEMYDYVLAGDECGQITLPEDGWDSETEELPESILAGYE